MESFMNSNILNKIRLVIICGFLYAAAYYQDVEFALKSDLIAIGRFLAWASAARVLRALEAADRRSAWAAAWAAAGAAAALVAAGAPLLPRDAWWLPAVLLARHALAPPPPSPGVCAAVAHAAGYLARVLPADGRGGGLEAALERYEARHGVRFAARRLLLVAPAGLRCPESLSAWAPRGELERCEPLPAVRRDVAGCPRRSYRLAVYRVRTAEGARYVAAEGAAALHTLWASRGWWARAGVSEPDVGWCRRGFVQGVRGVLAGAAWGALVTVVEYDEGRGGSLADTIRDHLGLPAPPVAGAGASEEGCI